MEDPPSFPSTIQDGYYRIRSNYGKLCITMKLEQAGDFLAFNTNEEDSLDPSQTFFVRYNSINETYTLRNAGTGLYLGIKYRAGWDDYGIIGVHKPQLWAIDTFRTKTSGNGYCLFLPGHAKHARGKGSYISSTISAPKPGSKVGVIWFDGSLDYLLAWTFEPSPDPISEPEPPLVASLPPLLPGVYKIQNVATQSLISHIADLRSVIVGKQPQAGNKKQEWALSIDNETQLFYVQSSSGSYLATDPINGFLTITEKRQLWDIRQGEIPEQYIFHIPCVNVVLHMDSIGHDTMNVTFQTRDNIVPVQGHRWMFLPVVTDPLAVMHSTPPSFPPLSNGIYRITNVSTRRALIEASHLVAKGAGAVKIGAFVACKQSEKENMHALWKVEVQPNILTYSIRNLASGRYLNPPHTVGPAAPGPKGNLMTGNGIYLWDIRQAPSNDGFCIHIPGTNLLIHSWGQSSAQEGLTVIWNRSDARYEMYRFEPIGEWSPSPFPETVADLFKRASGASSIPVGQQYS